MEARGGGGGFKSFGSLRHAVRTKVDFFLGLILELPKYRKWARVYHMADCRVQRKEAWEAKIHCTCTPKIKKDEAEAGDSGQTGPRAGLEKQRLLLTRLILVKPFYPSSKR